MNRIIFPLLALLAGNAFAQDKPAPAQVFFATDSHALSEASQETLDQLCASANNKSNYVLEISANTDARATASYNEALSRRRAQSVRLHLEACGVKLDTLIVHCNGEAKPAADNTTEQGMAYNRRVDIAMIAADVYSQSGIEDTPPPPLSDVLPDGNNTAVAEAEVQPCPGCRPIAEYLDMMKSKPQVVEATVTEKGDFWVEGQDGSKLYFPKGALPVKANEKVNVELQEISCPGSMIAHRVSTQNSRDLLSSAGMIDVKVKKGGKEMRLNPGKEFGWILPAEKIDPEMSTWYAKDIGDFIAWPTEAPGINFLGGKDDLVKMYGRSKGPKKIRRGIIGRIVIWFGNNFRKPINKKPAYTWSNDKNKKKSKMDWNRAMKRTETNGESPQYLITSGRFGGLNCDKRIRGFFRKTGEERVEVKGSAKGNKGADVKRSRSKTASATDASATKKGDKEKSGGRKTASAKVASTTKPTRAVKQQVMVKQDEFQTVALYIPETNSMAFSTTKGESTTTFDNVPEGVKAQLIIMRSTPTGPEISLQEITTGQTVTSEGTFTPNPPSEMFSMINNLKADDCPKTKNNILR